MGFFRGRRQHRGSGPQPGGGAGPQDAHRHDNTGADDLSAHSDAELHDRVT